MRKDQVFAKNGVLLSEEIVEFTEDEIRAKRNSLLAETDYLALSDTTLSSDMAAYRQALRDITSQSGFPTSVTWPTKPTE
jgi:hypothetical protein